jgi:hypothetical protein
MPAHWTYDQVDAAADLEQGDIVEPTAFVREILRDVHPHFLDPKYVSFLVLSQSCDLVRRRGYQGQPINLCVVRELGSIAGRLLELFCGSEISGVFRNENKLEGRRFLERVINQNEQAIGLFYLHPDADAGVSTPSVAMLRIAIALHTTHYDKIREARRGRLRPEFQAKLGWLVGNLYSRVGTEDWSEPPQRKKEQRVIVDQVMENVSAVQWASADAIARAKTAGLSVEGKTAEQVRDALASFEPQPADHRLLQELARVLAATDLGIPADAQKKVLKRVPNDPVIAELLRRLRRS